MKITVLGSSCGVPTKDRNTGGIAINLDSEIFLFDCGEGAQKALMQSKVSYMKIKAIVITHFHADHFLGLPGLLATLAMQKRTEDLTIYLPENTIHIFDSIFELLDPKPEYKIIFKTLKSGMLEDNKKYYIKAFDLNHSIKNYGLVFAKKGKLGKFSNEKAKSLGLKAGANFSKLQAGNSIILNGKTITPDMVMDYTFKKDDIKISYVTDTIYSNSYIEHIKDSTILFHESSFSIKDKDKAKERHHSTTSDAGNAAKKSNSKQLVLISMSPRYKDESVLELEAKKIFANTIASKDLMSFEVK